MEYIYQKFGFHVKKDYFNFCQVCLHYLDFPEKLAKQEKIFQDSNLILRIKNQILLYSRLLQLFKAFPFLVVIPSISGRVKGKPLFISSFINPKPPLALSYSMHWLTITHPKFTELFELPADCKHKTFKLSFNFFILVFLWKCEEQVASFQNGWRSKLWT